MGCMYLVLFKRLEEKPTQSWSIGRMGRKKKKRVSRTAVLGPLPSIGRLVPPSRASQLRIPALFPVVQCWSLALPCRGSALFPLSGAPERERECVCVRECERPVTRGFIPHSRLPRNPGILNQRHRWERERNWQRGGVEKGGWEKRGKRARE